MSQISGKRENSGKKIRHRRYWTYQHAPDHRVLHLEVAVVAKYVFCGFNLCLIDGGPVYEMNNLYVIMMQLNLQLDKASLLWIIYSKDDAVLCNVNLKKTKASRAPTWNHN